MNVLCESVLARLATSLIQGTGSHLEGGLSCSTVAVNYSL